MHTFLWFSYCQIYFFLEEWRYFTVEIISMHIISMVLTCMKMYAEAYLKLRQTSMVNLLLWKSWKSFIVDVLPVSKYTSGICFTLEKVYTMSICHFGLRNPGYNPTLNFLSIKFEISFDLKLFRPWKLVSCIDKIRINMLNNLQIPRLSPTFILS